ncbi:acidic mammalian chitinase-like [Centruroides vittatus]|uniref:acidic mammalian chitinase-like n=1 Tax=Centruroides vittatus TaxID=120091 RepID=UPI00350EF5CB
MENIHLIISVIFILFFACSISQQLNATDNLGNNKKIVCYYRYQGNESHRLTPDQIDVNLCTHIILGFAGVHKSEVSYDIEDIPGYRWTVSLKDKNPNLKIMLSLGGGGNEGGFTEAVSSKENREKFIESMIKLCRDVKLDGIDLDWEFPVWRHALGQQNLADKENLILLLKEFKLASEKEFSENPLLMSVAVAGPKSIVTVAYDISMMSKYADFINLMSYDYNDYYWYTPYVAHNSPLFKSRREIGYFATLNTKWSADYFISQGMDRSKLMIGLPLYAHTYKLLSRFNTTPGSIATGSGLGGGGLSYPGVCEFLKNGGTRMFDDEAKVPYAFKNRDWISYDDYESVKIKSEWTKENNYGGVMTFSLNTDDWKGTCDGKTKFPLMKIIKKIIHE